MKSYLDCWTQVAAGLLPQALAGAPELVESLPRPLGQGAFGFAATLAGDQQGRFSVVLDGTVLETPLLGEGMDQKAGWGEIVRETFEAAAGELLASAGKRCRVESVEEIPPESKVSRAFELKSAERSWTILVRDALTAAPVQARNPDPRPAAPGQTAPRQSQGTVPFAPDGQPPAGAPPLRPGLELLLDVELEASLRFGSREMLLGDILELGPGDVVQLDRHVSDPVDLIVADKIVASGEVVLVNGNFGLRVTQVATPRKRLESIRCLF